MRIALLAPLVAPIAPPYLGGAQALLADLAAGLAARGHAVTLYAADGSHVPGVATPTLGIDASLLRPARFGEVGGDAGGATASADAEAEDESDPLAADQATFLATYAFARAFRAVAAAAERHDLLHAHAYDWPAYAHATLQPLPVVHTLHLPALDPAISAVLARLAPLDHPYALASDAPRLVTVSHACAATYANVCRIDGVIYNGVPLERIPFSTHPAAEGYLLYAGRIAPEKGVEDALEIARCAGRRLLLAGGVYDRDYYETRVAPRLGEQGDSATYLGALPREGLWKLMAGAAALLAPARWEEPFGLVACEAQAAACPVIAYARGGLREVVEEGVTGWLIPPGDIEAAVRAVEGLDTLDRAACREHVARRFGLTAMLDAHEALYAGMLARSLADGEGC
jgi:glycosyltransferase involved in cell wall biosynthesis